MELRGIKYVGPFFDASGYGQASRGYALALHKMGVPLVIKPVSFEEVKPDLGEEGKILFGLQKEKVDYNIVLTHLTAEWWEKHYEPDKTNIGYTIWETDKLHPDWPGWINKYHAAMVGSEWNVEVCKKSGVTIPIYSVPHGIDLSRFDDVTSYVLPGVKKNAYKFYGIFQFTERKHPVALIKSYWYAFQNKENVALILKTYRSNFGDEEKDAIRKSIKRLKAVTPMDNHPPIYLILDMLSNDEVLGLHKFGDCFVSLDRGEGFGLCGFEAGASGNPIIVTGIGGALEYAKPEHSYLLNYTMTPVSGMPWSPWYRGDQLWAEPDCLDAVNNMRHVYNNRKEAAKKGALLRKYIEDNLTWDKVGQRMIDVIKSL